MRTILIYSPTRPTVRPAQASVYGQRLDLPSDVYLDEPSPGNLHCSILFARRNAAQKPPRPLPITDLFFTDIPSLPESAWPNELSITWKASHGSVNALADGLLRSGFFEWKPFGRSAPHLRFIQLGGFAGEFRKALTAHRSLKDRVASWTFEHRSDASEEDCSLSDPWKGEGDEWARSVVSKEMCQNGWITTSFFDRRLFGLNFDGDGVEDPGL